MFDLSAIQNALRQFGLDGWLLFDFRGSNLLSRRVLGLDTRPPTSRRFFYFIPTVGQPVKIVHRIEPGALDHLPGSKRIYLKWQELENALSDTVRGVKRLAMEWAPGISNPYISRVDAGTIEAVRAIGPEIVSSGDLIQLFESVWDDEQWALHQQAERGTTSAYEMVWDLVASAIRSGQTLTECQVQAAIMAHFGQLGLTTYSPPIVGVNAHSGDPHFENTPANDTPIREGDLLLVDLWAKVDKPRAVYSDLTRMGYVGKDVPNPYAQIFHVVATARDAAIERVRSAFASGRPLRGYEVDDAARRVIDDAGFGKQFAHRTGHNIGQEVHGNGAHMDNIETHEERLVLPRTCFSIEPGIYFDDFGVRSEVNVYIDAQGGVHVTGGPVQQRVEAILAR